MPPRRSMQHIVIRKRFEDLHAAIEAAATDEEIAKLARVASQASAVSQKFPYKFPWMSPACEHQDEKL